MIRLGNVYIGVGNNWRKRHGFPLAHTKRHPHERKDLPKFIRAKYHTMRKAGCTEEFTADFIKRWHNYDINA